MASFLYFLPGADQQAVVRDGRLNHDELRRWRLHEVLADVCEVPNHCVITKVEAGPDKSPGLILTAHPASPAGQVPRMPTYHAESQTWWRIGKDELEPWIGFQTDAMPTPEDLQRRDSISGYRWSDDHGRSWLVPVVRGMENQYGFLPVDYDWSCGTFTPGMILRSQFEDLWKESARISDHVFHDGCNVPEPVLAAFVARCFAINYRISPRELDVFRRLCCPVFDRSMLNLLASLPCDYPAWSEFAAKKKMTPSQAVRGGTHSSAGDPAGTVDLNRAEQNSE